MHVPRWLWGLWLLMFCALEGVAVFDSTPNDTLTQTTIHAVPGVGILLFLGWLGAHFGRRVIENYRTHRKSDGL